MQQDKAFAKAVLRGIVLDSLNEHTPCYLSIRSAAGRVLDDLHDVLRAHSSEELFKLKKIDGLEMLGLLEVILEELRARRE